MFLRNKPIMFARLNKEQCFGTGLSLKSEYGSGSRPFLTLTQILDNSPDKKEPLESV